MIVKIIKKVKKGKETSDLLVDDQKSEYGREITGHTSGDGAELLKEGFAKLYYGAWEKEFDFSSGDLSFNVSDTPEKRLNTILARADVVRAWIAECSQSDAEASGTAWLYYKQID